MPGKTTQSNQFTDKPISGDAQSCDVPNRGTTAGVGAIGAGTGLSGMGTGASLPEQSETSAGTSAPSGQKIAEKAHEAKDAVKQQAQQLKQDIASSVQQTGQDIKRTALDTTRRARQQARSLAAEQQSKVANELNAFSAAIRCAADRLHDERNDHLASYADVVADQMDRAAQYVGDNDINRIFDDVQRFARRRPELLLGGLFLVGLGISRFLKASADRHDTAVEQFTTPDTDPFPTRSAAPSGAPHVGPQFDTPAMHDDVASPAHW